MEIDYLRFRRKESDSFTTLKLVLQESAIFFDPRKYFYLQSWCIDPMIRVESKEGCNPTNLELVIKDNQLKSYIVKVSYHKSISNEPIIITKIVDALQQFFSEGILFEFKNWNEYKQSAYFEQDYKSRIIEKYITK